MLYQTWLLLKLLWVNQGNIYNIDVPDNPQLGQVVATACCYQAVSHHYQNTGGVATIWISMGGHAIDLGVFSQLVFALRESLLLEAVITSSCILILVGININDCCTKNLLSEVNSSKEKYQVGIMIFWEFQHIQNILENKSI